MSQFDGLLEVKPKKKTSQKKKQGSSPERRQSQSPAPPLNDKNNSPKSIAKSSNPDFVQTSIYIKKETQISVKSKLLTDQNKRDFSDLVEQLLSDWLKNKK